MSNFKTGFWALIVMVFLAVPALHAEDVGPEMLNMDGEPTPLKNYIGKGKWLVIKVWASDCHVCNESVHEMIALHKERGDKDISVLGIAVDGYDRKAAVEAFMKRHQVNFPNLIDDGAIVASVYYSAVGTPWIGATPTYLLFSPEGEIVAENLGAISKEVVETFIAKNECQRDSALC